MLPGKKSGESKTVGARLCNRIPCRRSRVDQRALTGERDAGRGGNRRPRIVSHGRWICEVAPDMGEATERCGRAGGTGSLGKECSLEKGRGRTGCGEGRQNRKIHCFKGCDYASVEPAANWRCEVCSRTLLQAICTRQAGDGKSDSRDAMFPRAFLG